MGKKPIELQHIKSKLKLDPATHDALTAAFNREPLSYSELRPLIDFAKEKMDYWSQIHAKLQVMSITIPQAVATWQLKITKDKPKKRSKP